MILTASKINDHKFNWEALMEKKSFTILGQSDRQILERKILLKLQAINLMCIELDKLIVLLISLKHKDELAEK
jgi:hypothetical protein